jgi:hypothetical protein
MAAGKCAPLLNLEKKRFFGYGVAAGGIGSCISEGYMGRIKSALEIALERTETVKGDRERISNYETRQRGKKLAGVFLEGGVSFEGEIKKLNGEEREALRQGIFDVLLPQVSLPQSEEDLGRIEKAGKGLAALTGVQFSRLYAQFVQALRQYLEETEEFDQAIKQQYAPKLRQKEEELARRLGRELRLDPFQDPEFVAFYNQNMNSLKGKYQSLVEQVRAEAARVFGGNGE